MVGGAPFKFLGERVIERLSAVSADELEPLVLELSSLFGSALDFISSLESGLGRSSRENNFIFDEWKDAFLGASSVLSQHPLLAGVRLRDALSEFRNKVPQLEIGEHGPHRDAILAVVDGFFRRCSAFISEYRSYADERESMLAAAPDIEVAKEILRVVPEQRPAPLRFRIEGDVLRLLHVAAEGDERTAAATAAARKALLRRGERLIAALREATNCHPRISVLVDDLQQLLRSENDIIELGIASLELDLLREKSADEVAGSMLAMIEAYSAGIGMYLAQFPEWADFAGNADAMQISGEDVGQLVTAAAETVQALRDAGPAVDPEVPEKLGSLVGLARDSGEFGKRQFLALVSTLGNLTAAIAKHCGEVASKSLEKAKEHLADKIGKAIAYGLIAAAVSAATALLPMTGRFAEVGWVKVAQELLIKELKGSGK